MKSSFHLIQILIVSFLVAVALPKPMPGAMRKIATNNNARFKIATPDKRDGDNEVGLNTNRIPAPLVAFANSYNRNPSGGGGEFDDDYYDELMETKCPPGFILYLKNGECVPDKCGFGTLRNHETGECMEDEMLNNIPIMGNNFNLPQLSPLRIRTRSFGRYNKVHRLPRLLMRLEG